MRRWLFPVSGKKDEGNGYVVYSLWKYQHICCCCCCLELKGASTWIFIVGNAIDLSCVGHRSEKCRVLGESGAAVGHCNQVVEGELPEVPQGGHKKGGARQSPEGETDGRRRRDGGSRKEQVFGERIRLFFYFSVKTWWVPEECFPSTRTFSLPLASPARVEQKPIPNPSRRIPIRQRASAPKPPWTLRKTRSSWSPPQKLRLSPHSPWWTGKGSWRAEKSKNDAGWRPWVPLIHVPVPFCCSGVGEMAFLIVRLQIVLPLF